MKIYNSVLQGAGKQLQKGRNYKEERCEMKDEKQMGWDRKSFDQAV